MKNAIPPENDFSKRVSLTLAEVELRVEEIAHTGLVERDDEKAHGMEDDLHQDVLRAIGNGTAEDPAGMARAALRTTEFAFARWCA